MTAAELAAFAALARNFGTPWAAEGRPTAQQQEALRSEAVLVVLDQPSAADLYAWASALRVPGSTLLVRGLGEGAGVDFSRLGCVEKACPLGLLIEKQAAPDRLDSPAVTPRARPRRPLRSIYLGDLTYPSAYRLGVAQGMALLGHLHRDVSIRDEAPIMDRQVREMKPDLIWTHMLLWPPGNGQTPPWQLLELSEQWRRQGAVVLIHDGDPRPFTRHPHDVSRAADLALLNHARPVPEWNVPTLHWPYAAFVQREIAAPNPALRADLVFAGIKREGSGYGDRTACLEALSQRLGVVQYPGPDGFNNRFQVSEIAPSCIAMLGFGRDDAPGWIDTRVFSVPGSGGVLIHDDTGGVLTPEVHFAPCKRYDVDSILAAFEWAKYHQARVREAAFAYVQAKHTWRHRVEAVIDLFWPEGGA